MHEKVNHASGLIKLTISLGDKQGMWFIIPIVNEGYIAYI